MGVSRDDRHRARRKARISLMSVFLEVLIAHQPIKVNAARIKATTLIIPFQPMENLCGIVLCYLYGLVGCYISSSLGRKGKDRDMRERIENQTMWGFALAFFGIMLYADAVGTGRAYGYTTGNVFEFVVGTVVVVVGTILLYLAGMNRKRMALASSYRCGRRVRGIGNSRTAMVFASTVIQTGRRLVT